MNIFHLGNYQFQYYICHHTQCQEVSICFVPLQETALHLYKQNETPQKITYEIYDLLENLLGQEMDFKPLFSGELDFFEVKVKAHEQNLWKVSENLRGAFQHNAA